MKKPLLIVATGFLLTSAACSALPGGGPKLSGPTPLPVAGSTPLPAAEVLFTATPPAGTPADADLALLVLDEVTGLPYNSQAIPMRRLTDGRWQVRLTPAVGSLLHYRYIRRAPSNADEVTALGDAIRFRVALISGPGERADIIAAWSDQPYAGSTGRIIGRINDARTGARLMQAIVNAGGITAFTDGEGNFRIDGLPAGVQQLTVYTTDGSFQAAEQGALVAAESATPAELNLRPADPVRVTFELTVPADTPPGAPLRMAGNLRSFGEVFADLPGGVTTAVGRMPTLVQVDATHFLLVTSLYAGTDLRYKYTLGDGLWDAERDGQGNLVTRQVIVPDQEVTIVDTVATWHAPGRASVAFQATVPANTPASDGVSIQFNPYAWFEPLPMWHTGDAEWSFTLFAPLDFSGPLTYRYCRNQQCGIADDVDSAGPNASGRPMPTGNKAIDTVRAWQWLEAALPPTNVVAPEITARPGFEAGYEMVPSFRPNWSGSELHALDEMTSSGANALTLTPTWILRRNNPLPALTFDPASAPLDDEVRMVVAEAGRRGLRVALHPAIRPASGILADWWSSSPRDSAWWTVWFEAYRSFLVTEARLAQEAGAAKLVLGGPDVAPALPGGTLADGTPSGAPPDADSRWRQVISDVRAVYQGRLAFEIDLGQNLAPLPPFLDAVDEVHVYWHAPLASSDGASFSDLRLAAADLLDKTLIPDPGLQGKPLVLIVEYLSVAGGLTGCAREPNGACRPVEAFDEGAVVDPDLQVNLDAQSEAVNAVLLEASQRSQVTGFYVRRYNPTVALQDKSASVNGKPARDVLWFWYPRLVVR